MKEELKVGERVICRAERVKGTIIKIYKPTGADAQIMVLTDDFRKFHAPYSYWEKE